jgi:hypothetical protein
MKKLIISLLFIILCSTAQSQNITNTLGLGGVFSIKYGALTFVSISQTDSILNLNYCLRLPNTTSSSTGVIYKGPDRFLHNYGTSSLFLGINAGNFTMTGSSNTAIGSIALRFNTIGNNNTALGQASLYSNTEGSHNTAVGQNSLFTNNSGSSNTAVGKSSLTANTIGNGNTALGANTLLNNTANENTGVGTGSLYNNSTGSQNTAVGVQTLYNTNGGNVNTAIGWGAGSTNTGGSNLTLIGFNSQPTSVSVSNQITLGNSAINSLRCAVTTITALSDMRDKKNIKDLSLGLDFITKLKPRVFNWDKREWYDNGVSDGSKMQNKLTAGFIAQELDEVQTSENADWLSLVLKDNPEKLEATPGNLLPIMVKALQELKEKNDGLKTELNDLKSRLTALEQKSGNQNTQTAGFLSGNINISFWLLLLFSSVGIIFFLLKKYAKK